VLSIPYSDSAGFTRSNAGRPRIGSKIGEVPDREIGKPGENRGKIVAHWEFQPAAALHDRENRRNLRSVVSHMA